jgi:hypothetical protein
MLLETVYAPSVSLPKADEVVNDGFAQVAPPAEVGGGAPAGALAGAVAAGEVGAALGWVGESDGDVPGEEADGEDDADGAACDRERDGAEATAAGVVGPVAVTVFSIMAACFPLEAACLGT